MTIYQQIAQDIKKAIDSREMKAGDKIPSVSELRKHYQVSHITVLRAYTELTEQKYIQMKKGQGYFVRNMQQPRNMTLEHGVIGCFLRPLRPETETDNFFNRINLGVQLECASRRIHWLNLHSLSVLNQWPATENAVQQIEPEMIAFAGQVDGLLIDERIPDAMIENLRKLTSKPMLLPSVPPTGRICGTAWILPSEWDMIRFFICVAATLFITALNFSEVSWSIWRAIPHVRNEHLSFRTAVLSRGRRRREKWMRLWTGFCQMRGVCW